MKVYSADALIAYWFFFVGSYGVYLGSNIELGIATFVICMGMVHLTLVIIKRNN